MRFVKFKFDEGEPIYINPAQVVSVQKAYGDDKHTLVSASSSGLGGGWLIPLPVGEVLERLKFG